MKSKIIISILTLAMVVVFMPFATVNATAYSVKAYSGISCTSDPSAATAINRIVKKYPNRTYCSGQCWGYAVKVNSTLAKGTSTRYYRGLRFTKKNFLNKCLGVKAGTHLRLSRQSTFSGYRGHSVVLLKVTRSKVYWADNNYYKPNRVAYYSGSVNDFMSWYSTYGYLNMVEKTTSYKTYKTLKVDSTANSSAETIDVDWSGISGSKKYYVYKSSSEDSGFKKIGTTTSTSFTDDSAAAGQTSYYRVEAVKSSGNVYSNTTDSTLTTTSTDTTSAN